MHPVSNQVDIDTEKIAEKFCQEARPGFTGSIIARIKVMPTAAHEVEFTFETKRTLQLSKPEAPEVPHVTNARVASVRRALAENAALFRLGMPLTGVEAHFVDGELRKLHAIEVE
jgi:hypothetical protein